MWNARRGHAPQALGGFDLSCVGEPLRVRLGSVVVASATKPPVLVLSGSLALIVSLLGEQTFKLVGHARSFGAGAVTLIFTSHATELAMKHAA